MINLFLHTGKPVTIKKLANPEAVEFIYIDLFCGAGGTSTGLHMAEIDGKQVAIVAACVNHDPNAIKSHWANYPDVVHFEEDIRTLELTPLADLIEQYREMYPNAKIVLWASLECTNFSKAKGGQPRDADSRTLADHLHRYITALNPDYIQIENVVEFMSWGPLNEHGKPVSKRSGSDWLRWRNEINAYGYRDEWKEMNSADFGAYTSRNRLFGCFAKEGLPVVWPEPTHSKKTEKQDLFGGGLKKWKAVKDVLDFEDEGVSIFNRKKPLSPKTLERIFAGLIKYVAGGKEAFLSTYNSGKSDSRNISLDRPCRTLLTSNTFAFVKPSFFTNYHHSSSVNSIDDPCPTLTCKDKLGLTTPTFLAKYFSGKPEGKVISTNGPAGAITTSANQALVIPSFLMKYYGNGDNIQSVNEPAGTLTTKDRFTKVWLDKTYTGKDNHQSVENPAGVIMVNDHHQLVQAKAWIDRNFSGGGQHSSIDRPAGSILNVPKMNLVQPFIMATSFGNIGKSIDEPAPTLVASRRHHYIVNPSHGGHSTSTDKPCPVIIARQDKAPLYLVQADNGHLPVFEAPGFFNDDDFAYFDWALNGCKGDEHEMSIRIKIVEFMILYGISDIKMRMLKVSELKLIQGFPKNYVLEGTQTDQKKFIGNSVVPHVVKCWTETMAVKIREIRRVA